jgi:hypothetical protein
MKLLHFSIRDLLWLTVLCAVLAAWWIDHRRQTEWRYGAQRQVEFMINEHSKVSSQYYEFKNKHEQIAGFNEISE